MFFLGRNVTSWLLLWDAVLGPLLPFLLAIPAYESSGESCRGGIFLSLYSWIPLPLSTFIRLWFSEERSCNQCYLSCPVHSSFYYWHDVWYVRNALCVLYVHDHGGDATDWITIWNNHRLNNNKPIIIIIFKFIIIKSMEIIKDKNRFSKMKTGNV